MINYSQLLYRMVFKSHIDVKEKPLWCKGNWPTAYNATELNFSLFSLYFPVAHQNSSPTAKSPLEPRPAHLLLLHLLQFLQLPLPQLQHQSLPLPRPQQRRLRPHLLLLHPRLQLIRLPLLRHQLPAPSPLPQTAASERSTVAAKCGWWLSPSGTSLKERRSLWTTAWQSGERTWSVPWNDCTLTILLLHSQVSWWICIFPIFNQLLSCFVCLHSHKGLQNIRILWRNSLTKKLVAKKMYSFFTPTVTWGDKKLCFDSAVLIVPSFLA